VCQRCSVSPQCVVPPPPAAPPPPRTGRGAPPPLVDPQAAAAAPSTPHMICEACHAQITVRRLSKSFCLTNVCFAQSFADS